MMVWTKIERPLVCMLPKATTLPLAGSWNSSPGLSSTNSTTDTTTGAQSAAITLHKLLFFSNKIKLIADTIIHNLLCDPFVSLLNRNEKVILIYVWGNWLRLMEARNEWQTIYEETNKKVVCNVRCLVHWFTHNILLYHS